MSASLVSPADVRSVTAAPKTVAELWLSASTDSLAGLRTTARCITTLDLKSDGDYCLVVATKDKKLIPYHGSDRGRVKTLVAEPTALVSFQPDAAAPVLACVSGSHVFVYRNLSPYYKFTLPEIGLHADEAQVWTKLKAKTMDALSAKDALVLAQENGVSLSMPGMSLCVAQSDEECRATVESALERGPVKRYTVCTCAHQIYQSREVPGSISCLVLGTESGQILILQPDASKVDHVIQLPSIPVRIAIAGTLAVENTIVVQCRDEKVYLLRNGSLIPKPIDPGGTIAGVDVLGVGHIVIARTDGVVQGFVMHRRRLIWTSRTGERIVALRAIPIEPMEKLQMYAVGLASGEVQTYGGTMFLCSFATRGAPVDIHFGCFGREPKVMTTVSSEGALDVRVLRRTIDMGGLIRAVGASRRGVAPPEQRVPIALPKISRLAVDMAERERADAVSIHKAYQRDLCVLRLDAARHFVAHCATSGETHGIAGREDQALLQAHLHGVGPLFMLQVQVDAHTHSFLRGIVVIDPSPRGAAAASSTSTTSHPYHVLGEGFLPIPAVTPGAPVRVSFFIRDLDSIQPPGTIRVALHSSSSTSTTPVASLLVSMPASAPEE